MLNEGRVRFIEEGMENLVKMTKGPLLAQGHLQVSVLWHKLKEMLRGVLKELRIMVENRVKIT